MFPVPLVLDSGVSNVNCYAGTGSAAHALKLATEVLRHEEVTPSFDEAGRPEEPEGDEDREGRQDVPLGVGDAPQLLVPLPHHSLQGRPPLWDQFIYDICRGGPVGEGRTS